MTEQTTNSRWTTRKPVLALAGAALFAAGAGAASLVGATRPPAVMAPMHAVAVNALADDGDIVTVKGKVAQVYAENFALADNSGKVLVEAGHGWRPMPLVAAGQDVTVQGRFTNGALHAQYLVGADGRVVALHGRGGPGRPHDRGGPDGPGERGRHGDRGDNPQAAPAVAAPPGSAPATNTTAP